MKNDTNMHNTLTYILRRKNRNRLCDDFFNSIVLKILNFGNKIGVIS